MKKLVLTSLCVLGLAGAVFAQGTAAWSTISPAAMSAQTNSTVYSPLFGGGSTGNGAIGKAASGVGGPTFYWALLYTGFSGSQLAQPSTLSSLATWSQSGLTATNANGVNGFLTPIAPGTAVTLPWDNGTTNSIMMVGWSANLGTTWTSALSTLQSSSALGNVIGNAFLGLSNTGYINPNVGNPGVTLFNATATSSGLPINSLLTTLYVVPVPEPSTMVLAGLGGLSLLAFRRKK